MEKSSVNIDISSAVNGITVVPVVKLSISCYFTAGISAVAIKRPVAIVLVSITGKRYFRITGEEVSLENLIEEFPSIKESLMEI